MAFRSNAGFSLIEVLVIISIVTIISLIAAPSFPVARSKQELRLAQQQVASMVNEALQRAMNETRTPECMSSNPTDEKKCSDVGVYVAGSTITMFADTTDDNTYTQADSIIKSIKITGNVQVSEQLSLLFEAIPPNVIAFGNGQVIPPKDSHLKITLTLGKFSNAYSIDAYGHLAPTSTP